MEESAAFEGAIVGGDRNAVAALCEARAATAASGEESETWAFLRLSFKDDSRRCGLRDCFHRARNVVTLELPQA